MKYMLAMPFMAMVRSSWRKRNHYVSTILKNPYWDRNLTLSELLSDPLQVVVVPVKAEFHNTTELELLALGSIVAQMRTMSAFEIGTFDGRTTRTIAANTMGSGHVWTINLAPGQGTSDDGESTIDSLLNLKVASGFRFANTPEAARITQLYGDSAKFDFSPYHNTIDIVFVDGAHTEAYVANDTEIALRLLSRSGGLIVWHDAPYYGVVKFLTRKISEGWPVRWIEGTTLALGYAVDGQFIDVPCPLPAGRSSGQSSDDH